jgi:purine nucleosidase
MRVVILMLLTVVMSLIPAAGQKQKIVFDCDLAGDIDDAFALALILSSPEFEVLGVVMDHGDTLGRARVACRMLYETGREDIPVVVGRHTPMIVGRDSQLAGKSQQFAWGEGFEKIRPSTENAADFVIRSLRAYPNEVILFTVGPVPNIQDVILKDPGALRLAQRVIAMFGSFYMGYGGSPRPDAEWNVRADVKSAQMLASSGANITYAGLDITTLVRLNGEERTRLLMRQSPLTDALCGLYTLWRYEGYSRPDPTLFDPVAVGMALWPELFTTRKAHVRVTDDGYTVIDETKAPNCEVGLSIDREEFIKRIMDRYLKQNLGRQD